MLKVGYRRVIGKLLEKRKILGNLVKIKYFKYGKNKRSFFFVIEFDFIFVKIVFRSIEFGIFLVLYDRNVVCEMCWIGNSFFLV